MKSESVPLSIGGQFVTMVTEEPSDDPNITFLSVVTNNPPEDVEKRFNQNLNESADLLDRKDYQGWLMSRKTILGVKQFLAQELTSAYQKGVEDERERIIKEYGGFNDGCGCCMDDSLEEAIKKETQPTTKDL